MTTIRRFLPAMIGAALLAGAAACSGSHDGAAPAPKPTAEVSVRTLSTQDGAATFQSVGRVKNVRESVLTSKVMGTVVEVRVKSGDAVKKGDLLIRVDDRDVQGQVQQAGGGLAQAEAAHAIAKTNLTRFEDLFAKGSASQAELDKARYEFESAAGALKAARGAVATAGSMAGEARIAAPFDGRVVDTLIEQGEMVAPGRPLVKVEGESKLEFETTVDERDVRELRVGQDVAVSLDLSRDERREVRGAISEIVPASDTGTHTTTVRIALAETEGLRSGAFGRVNFPRSAGGPAAVAVPADRIVRRGQLAGVFIVDGADTVRLRLVREGRARGEEIEILSGLADGDRLVVSDIAPLIDGQPAQVRP